jgi:hypothetical protein
MSRQGGIRDGKRGMCAPFDGDGWRTVLMSQLYWPRTIVFCREQRFLHCFAVSSDFLCTVCFGCEPVIFCGLLACCEQGTEFLDCGF